MKITVARGELADSLALVGRGISSRSTLPILSGILISAADELLVMQSSDLEVAIKTSVSARVEQAGETVIPGRLFGDIIRSLPEAAVTVESTAHDRVTVSCGQSSFQVKTLSAEDFPKFPEVNVAASASVKTETMTSVIKQVSRSVSRDETRPILTGILTVLDGPTLKMVATDSYRLSVREVELEKPAGDRIEVVVPGKTLEEVPRLAGSAEEIVMGVSENQVVFDFGATKFVSRRIEGSFPNYNQLLPKEHETEVSMDRGELLEAVKRVSLLTQPNVPLRVKTSMEDETVTLHAVTQDVGEAKEDIPAKITGNDVEIAFNPAFLADGVSAAGAERLRMEAIGPLKPAVLRSEDAEDYTYLLMPVRVG